MFSNTRNKIFLCNNVTCKIENFLAVIKLKQLI